MEKENNGVKLTPSKGGLVITLKWAALAGTLVGMLITSSLTTKVVTLIWPQFDMNSKECVQCRAQVADLTRKVEGQGEQLKTQQDIINFLVSKSGLDRLTPNAPDRTRKVPRSQTTTPPLKTPPSGVKTPGTGGISDGQTQGSQVLR